MPKIDTLHAKLDVLETKLEEARTQLEFRQASNDGHELTRGELLARYRYLKHALDEDIVTSEAHGHRIGALEQDAIAWMKSIDLTIA